VRVFGHDFSIVGGVLFNPGWMFLAALASLRIDLLPIALVILFLMF
jgi:hypothetical protein